MIAIVQSIAQLGITQPNGGVVDWFKVIVYDNETNDTLSIDDVPCTSDGVLKIARYWRRKGYTIRYRTMKLHTYQVLKG